MKRRRFLSLAAAFACAPSLGRADTWSGVALGADVSVSLYGPRALTGPALAEVPRLLEDIEQSFSLYRPDSALSRLNEFGYLHHPDAAMVALVAQADAAWRMTGGLFDPTVQPLWQAMAQGGDLDDARRAVGWHRVAISEREIRLARGQALTFNGIAQGYATDRVRELLRRHGATQALIDIGEAAAIGGPFTLGLADPQQGHVGTRALTDSAIASSSPGALRFGAQSHILHPEGRSPLWSTVSIEAPTATMADALSTAAVFMDRAALLRLKTSANLHRITVIDSDGNLATL